MANYRLGQDFQPCSRQRGRFVSASWGEIIFLIFLAIGGQRLQIGPNDRADRPSLSLLGDLARRRPALAQRLLQAFDCHGQANLIPIPEAIGDRLCDAEDLHGDPVDSVGLNLFGQQTICETYQPNGRAFGSRGPVLLTHGEPNFPWQLIGQPVERQGGNEANDALGNPFCGLCQTVVNVEGCIRKLIKSSREPMHLAVPFHAAHGGGCYARLAQLCQAEIVRDMARFEEHWHKALDAWFKDGTDTPGLVMIKVHAERIHYWNGMDDGEVVL